MINNDRLAVFVISAVNYKTGYKESEKSYENKNI
jgi:kynureninase